jgi:hypothetical protein
MQATSAGRARANFHSLEHVSGLDIRSLLPVSALLLNGCQQDADGDPFGRISDIFQRWKRGGEAQSAVIRIAPIGPGSPCRGERQTDIPSKLDNVPTVPSITSTLMN